mgnify:CR=1 FL=1
MGRGISEPTVPVRDGRLGFTDPRPLARCRPSGVPAATLSAALTSALQVKPQEEQTYSAWLLREFLSIHPQAPHDDRHLADG